MNANSMKLNKGFYIACEEQEFYGLAFAMGYIPANKDFQITLMLGNLSVAVGYTF
jgi:hypothetical protein